MTTSEISLVKIGQPVRMRVSSCPYTDYGNLLGEITAISPDVITQADSTAYEVTIQPQNTVLEQGTRQCTIQSGMDSRADIITEEETLYKNSPDDPLLKEYWEKRTKKREENRLTQNLFKGKCKIATSTEYKCRWCGQQISSEGLNNIHPHHVVPKSIGGKDTYENLMYLHAECHRQVTKLGELKPNTLKKLGITAQYDQTKQKWRVNKNPSTKKVKLRSTSYY